MTAAPAPIVGIDDPKERWPSFREDGWYAFQLADGRHVVLHARRFDRQFVALAEAPEAEPLLYASESAFEFWCVGKVDAVEPGLPRLLRGGAHA